jgi:hypothetical protein
LIQCPNAEIRKVSRKLHPTEELVFVSHNQEQVKKYATLMLDACYVSKGNGSILSNLGG